MYIHSYGRQARKSSSAGSASLAQTSLPPPLPHPPFVFLRSTTEAIYSLYCSLQPLPLPPLILNEIEC